ncbi:hypothetical protein ACJIZ3_023537 [Penstemon smallii]|uniref:Uncharacterized protein n=1 Tax=Penstemon smallii TaxID=265156 RepID=A0ABD3S5L2_9LAMI
MASSFITLSKPFASHKANLPFPSTKAPTGFRRSLRVNAIATKYELTKVVPQADRVLIRLEELPQVLMSEGIIKGQIQMVLFGDVLLFDSTYKTNSYNIIVHGFPKVELLLKLINMLPNRQIFDH